MGIEYKSGTDDIEDLRAPLLKLYMIFLIIISGIFIISLIISLLGMLLGPGIINNRWYWEAIISVSYLSFSISSVKMMRSLNRNTMKLNIIGLVMSLVFIILQLTIIPDYYTIFEFFQIDLVLPLSAYALIVIFLGILLIYKNRKNFS